MDDIEEIKKRIDISELIGGYVPLKKAGVNYKGLCPFHKEDTPSFMVSPEKQIWHCFGCSEGGDVFTFIEKIEGLEFRDTLKLLAEKAGVKLKKIDLKISQRKAELSDINEAAANFYHQVLLNSKTGKKALLYLKKRGLKTQIIREFQIGYAPNQWEATYKALTIKKHFSPEEIERAGLVIKSLKKISSNPYYDRFRGRIMFPIRNIAGTVVGFSGRVLDPDAKDLPAGRQEAKYVNTPETAIFHKSQILFGLDLARQAVRQEDLVILVEGQMDVVSCHQAGFKNIVATSGTALTADHIETLKKYTENIAFAFDQDSAGENAAKRAIEVANEAGINAKLIILPSGEDPDSLVSKNPEMFKEAINLSKNAMDFYLISAFSDLKDSLSVEDKRRVTQELLPIIKKIADPVIQGEYIQKLAQRINTDDKYLYEAMQKINTNSDFRRTKNKIRETPFQENLEERVIAEMIAFPKIAGKFIKQLKISDFDNEVLKKVYSEIKKLYNVDSKDVDFKKIKSKVPAEFSKRLDVLILKIQDEFTDLSEKEIFEELGISVNRLRSNKFIQIKKEFEQKIRQAEEKGNKEKVKKLIKLFQQKIIEAGRI